MLHNSIISHSSGFVFFYILTVLICIPLMTNAPTRMGGGRRIVHTERSPLSPSASSSAFTLGCISWSSSTGFQEKSWEDVGLEVCNRFKGKATPLLATEPKSSFVIPYVVTR